MRTIFLLALLIDLATVFGQSNSYIYNIPAAGKTVTFSPPSALNNVNIIVGTLGNVNLGSNTYTLTYASLPVSGTSWTVIADFRKLTQSANGANVTIFGVKPLQAHPTVDTFNITFTVLPDSVNNKYLYYIYNGLNDGGVINAATIFNGTVRTNSRFTAADSALFFGKTYLKPISAITAGQTVIAQDTGGRLTYGCAPWCITGNTGLLSTNYLGTTDTVPLRFRTNNTASGIIDHNLQNTGIGYRVFLSNTTGATSVAVGDEAYRSNTTGNSNTAIGFTSLYSNTTGSSNTALGYAALNLTTTANANTGIGTNAGNTATTGGLNTCVGYESDVATNSTNNAIAIGYGATAATKGIAIGTSASASQNQLAIAGIRSISIPNATNSIRYVLTDTSGTGDFVPQPNPINQQSYLTPVTGDSVTVTTTSNFIQPAGTIANFTIILPASPYSGQLLEFSSEHTITNFKWSTALNQAVSVSNLPSTLAANGTIKIMYNSQTTSWRNW